MTKSTFLGLRVPPTLHERIGRAAAKRGMNTSEFIRYVLTVFFDREDDNNHHLADSRPQD